MNPSSRTKNKQSATTQSVLDTTLAHRLPLVHRGKRAINTLFRHPRLEECKDAVSQTNVLEMICTSYSILIYSLLSLYIYTQFYSTE